MEFITEKNRIYAQDGNGALLAEITFPDLSETAVCINHTFVDSSLRGKGIGAQLIEKVAAFAKENNKQIKAECSYAAGWFEKHPEYAYLLVN